MPTTKRHLRLKEHTPGSSREHVPSPAQHKVSDDTLEEGPFLARADDNGFLMTGNNPDPGNTSIVFLGGSFVESMYASELNRFPSIVERNLIPSGYRILNGGYSGTNTLHLAHLLTGKIPPLVGAGGQVLVFVGQSDAEVLLTEGAYWASNPRIAPIQPLSTSVASPYDSTEKAVEAMVTLVAASGRALGLDIAMAVSPFRDGDFNSDKVLRQVYRRDRNTYKRITEIRRVIQRTTREVAQGNGIPCFDGHAATGNGHPSLFYDVMHLNTQGQLVFAENLTTWITTEWTGTTEGLTDALKCGEEQSTLRG